jgi:hypothetical protein
MKHTLKQAVLEDIRCHRLYGVDLNPFSTPGYRRSWQNGFGGTPEVLLDFDDCYQRGQLAAALYLPGLQSGIFQEILK